MEALNNLYQEFKKLNKFERKEKIYYEPLILSYADLTVRLKEEKGEAFDIFYKACFLQCFAHWNTYCCRCRANMLK